MKIAVFCSANEHIDPDFFSLTEEFGKWMAQNHHDLIFGGTNHGLMNCIAKAMHQGGGRVIGYHHLWKRADVCPIISMYTTLPTIYPTART